MLPLDLQSAVGLERAEVLSAAVARAETGIADLQYRRHLLHRGRRLVAARAPHVHPDVGSQDLADLRGATDAMAMWLRHSDPAVRSQHRPEDSLEDLVYEILEQLRVEALIPEELPGARANVSARFWAWSDAFVAERLLEDDLALLVFTVVHVCRSRILAQPIEERVNDHTEATRAGIYESLGTHLRDLRPNVGDQRAFAPHAAAIARAVGELAESAGPQRPGGRPPSALLAMVEPDPADDLDLDAQVTSAGARGRSPRDSAYAAFTTEFDREAAIGELALPHALRATREQLDGLEAEHRPLASYVARRAHRLFPAPIDWAWQSEQEEGWLDPRLLARLASGGLDGRVFRQRIDAARPAGAVTFLVDCSGSMKGSISDVAALVDIVVRALDRVDVATEVLGFTTGAWNGGRAYRSWLAAGRPAAPGRLNEVCHVVFKDAATPWRRARGRLSGMLWTPMFREGIDGEALLWAHRRLVAHDAPRRCLVMISDGSPMDGATSLTNDENFLDRHVAEVAAAIEADQRVRLFGLGIGHDMSTYLSSSRIVDPGAILHRDVAAALLDFLSAGRP